MIPPEMISCIRSNRPAGRATAPSRTTRPRSGTPSRAPQPWEARSGAENIYKIYAESFVDRAHLDTIVAEARAIVDRAMGVAA